MPKTVLTIDDDTAITELLAMLLRTHGYEVKTVNTGEDGVDAIKKMNPHVVILDLMMPKMDGFAVCKELQDPRWSKYRDIPILILTSVREEASRRRYELETGLALDVDDYVEKPMSPDVLLKRVSTLIKREKS